MLFVGLNCDVGLIWLIVLVHLRFCIVLFLVFVKFGVRLCCLRCQWRLLFTLGVIAGDWFAVVLRCLCVCLLVVLGLDLGVVCVV